MQAVQQLIEQQVFAGPIGSFLVCPSACCVDLRSPRSNTATCTANWWDSRNLLTAAAAPAATAAAAACRCCAPRKRWRTKLTAS